MRLLGWLVAGLIALAVLQLAIQLLVLSVIAAVVIGLIAAPRQTLAILLALIILQAFAAHPAIGLVAVIFFATCGWMTRSERASPKRPKALTKSTK